VYRRCLQAAGKNTGTGPSGISRRPGFARRKRDQGLIPPGPDNDVQSAWSWFETVFGLSALGVFELQGLQSLCRTLTADKSVWSGASATWSNCCAIPTRSSDGRDRVEVQLVPIRDLHQTLFIRIDGMPLHTAAQVRLCGHWWLSCRFRSSRLRFRGDFDFHKGHLGQRRRSIEVSQCSINP